MKKVVVVGGGAAGLMAAMGAAEQGGQVILLEKMPAVGRKMLITGKGRCNFTNSCDLETIIQNMPGNGSFLYSSLYAFTNRDIMEFLERAGVPVKVERGGRAFPVSDKASDVVNAFVRTLRDLEVDIRTGQTVRKVMVQDGRVKGVQLAGGGTVEADAVILTTGGSSYPGTGSSGDGFRMAAELGHTIIPLKPSLVPLETEEEWVKDAQGLSLRNVNATVFSDGKKKAEKFGEMLFTHYGVSGPIILSLSNVVSSELAQQVPPEVTLEIDLKPALTPEVLDERLQRDFEKFARRQTKNAFGELLPAKLIPIIIDLAYIDPEKPVHQITKAERGRILDCLKHLTLTIRGTRPLAEAIVTAGGVHVKEIQPSTLESKLVSGLFFAGEVMDIDGYTGGYNLQAAFSTGYAAGRHAGV